MRHSNLYVGTFISVPLLLVSHKQMCRISTIVKDYVNLVYFSCSWHVPHIASLSLVGICVHPPAGLVSSGGCLWLQPSM